MQVFKKGFYYAYSYLTISQRDILLASFPKAGNTWVRIFIFHYLLKFYRREENFEVNFDTLDRYMPEIGNKSIFQSWIFNPTRRILKTHNKNNKIIKKIPVIYIDRDPRDIMVSYFHYTKKSNRFKHNLNFGSFIRNRKYGLEAYYKHKLSYEQHTNIKFINYEDIKSDPVKNFTNILLFIGVEINQQRIKNAIYDSNMENTRKAQLKSSKDYNKQFKDNFTFARKGEKKQWIDYFQEEDLQYFEIIKRKYENSAEK